MAGNRLIDQLHFEACEKKLDSYVDPTSGYRVFTSQYLEKREDCCGCACRHCPFEYRNVSEDLKAGLRLDPYFFNFSPQKEVDLLFWSGGKDSFLALNKLLQESERAVVLMTAYDGLSESISQGEVRLEQIKSQAVKMGASLVLVPLYASHTYEARIQLAIARLLSKTNIKRVVFGDLHLEHIRSWREENFSTYLQSHGAEMYFPLWKLDYESLILELEKTGAKSYLSAISCEKMKLMSAPGDEFNRSLMEKLPGSVDGFGENGEFHTYVDPPLNFMRN